MLSYAGMKYIFVIFTVLLVLGGGCADSALPAEVPGEQPVVVEEVVVPEEAIVVLPVEGYAERRTVKVFGQYVSDRFTGYHVGDDIEFGDVLEEVPVTAVMDGTVVQIGYVSGYGGMAVIDHGEVNAIYGHIDLSSSSLKAGDAVTMGQFIANLGEGGTTETDGERKHLHFGVYDGAPTRMNGYEANASSIDYWINPQDFFTERGVNMEMLGRNFSSSDTGGDVFLLEFSLPDDMGVEYIASIQALNIFTLHGASSARDRSVMLLRYFDAAQFLTLSTVDIYSTTNLTVGRENYLARQYDIAKKSAAADFFAQPSWRNGRHIVTDFTNANGYGRYYVVAASPDIDAKMYEDFLRTIAIR